MDLDESEFKDANLQGAIEGAVRGMVHRSGGTLGPVQEVQLAGLPAQEYDFDSSLQKVHYRVRGLPHAPHTYVLGFVYKDSQDAGEGDRFFESFRLH